MATETGKPPVETLQPVGIEREDIAPQIRQFAQGVENADARLKPSERFELLQRKAIFWMALSVVVVLFGFSLFVVASDVLDDSSIDDKKLNWFLNILNVLFGFTAGALWPSAQK